MAKEESELIISNEPEIGENTMYIIPSNLSSLKFLSSNTFDFCLIKDCPVTSLTSLCLSQIFRVMKYQARVEILISQPITVMQELDSKQIEAHCEHVGFENIATEDAVYTDISTLMPCFSFSIFSTAGVITSFSLSIGPNM